MKARVDGRLWILTEQDSGWLATDAYRGVQRHYGAAADALKAIRRSDARRAKALGGVAMVVSRIEWNTTTNVGRSIVRALQGE